MEPSFLIVVLLEHPFALWFHKAELMQWHYGTAWELQGVPVDLNDLKTQVVY